MKTINRIGQNGQNYSFAPLARALRKDGWRVLRVWEHELRKPERAVARILGAMRKGDFNTKGTEF